MRYLLGVVVVAFAISPVEAAVPKSITTLLGPSIGYLQAQSDLCEWSLNEKIHTAYQNAFQQIGMTDAQQTAVWAEAKTRETRLTSLPEQALARMKADICSPDKRAEVERGLAD